jgi:hypothetical protein
MYNQIVKIEFDAAKNEANIAKHGIDMALATEFEFETAVFSLDTRKTYGETRYVAIGCIAGRLHVLVFTKRGQTVRVISLRKANQREARAYHGKA